jgi:ribonucleoside-diphosphate reductase alpha chain
MSASAAVGRRRLPTTRTSITHRFQIQQDAATIHKGYLTVGLYEDGTPGEIFIRIAKEGSTLSGFADAFSIAISMCLQYGVPLKDLANKFKHMDFEPSGMTTHKQIKFAKSIVDYIFQWMELRFSEVS